MPLVAGDRLRTADGRVEIDFPDGSAIEVGPNSEVEVVSNGRVRTLGGTVDSLDRPAAPPPTQSAGYLPQELQQYGPTFDQNGAWAYDASYGNVWYPRVAADWRPYYYGSWSAVPSYGWTWVGLDPWAWPTHHYGRWGYARNRWFWMPGRVWAPAWVSWAYADDYVSWCPLGFDGRPVFALSIGFGRPWFGWTVLSRGYFGSHGYFANRYAVDPRRFDGRARFVQASRLPLSVGRRGGFGVRDTLANRAGGFGARETFGNRAGGFGARETFGNRAGGFGGREAIGGRRDGYYGSRESLGTYRGSIAPRPGGSADRRPPTAAPRNFGGYSRTPSQTPRTAAPAFRSYAPPAAAPRAYSYRPSMPAYRQAPSVQASPRRAESFGRMGSAPSFSRPPSAPRASAPSRGRDSGGGGSRGGESRGRSSGGHRR
jgi:hypothetical protein